MNIEINNVTFWSRSNGDLQNISITMSWDMENEISLEGFKDPQKGLYITNITVKDKTGKNIFSGDSDIKVKKIEKNIHGELMFTFKYRKWFLDHSWDSCSIHEDGSDTVNNIYSIFEPIMDKLNPNLRIPTKSKGKIQSKNFGKMENSPNMIM